MPAVVAIIGRPNVGKSTLFNRILGKRRVIVSPVSGTTRDPVTAVHEGEHLQLILVDTGGIEFQKPSDDDPEKKIEDDVQTQARLAIADADIILFCIDTRQEITSAEQDVVSFLRKKSGNKPILLVGTKADGKERVLDESDLYALGISEYQPIFIAALQGAGIGELLETVESILLERGFLRDPERPDEATSIAVLGRPNVGKSSLINALTNSEKLIVSDVAGTTRDSIDTEIIREGEKFILIDTAGIRRKSKIERKGIEQYSIMRSIASLQRSDIALFLVDAAEGVAHQDKHIIDHILEAKTGLIVVVNKWDILRKKQEDQNEFLHSLRYDLDFIPWAPVLFTSATEKKNIHKIFSLVREIQTERTKHISTGKLNAFLQEVQHLHPLAGVKNTHPRIKYGTQIGTEPPHFVFHGNRLDTMHFSARRYLENRLRDAFGFAGTPIVMEMTTQKNPYHTRKKIRLPARGRE